MTEQQLARQARRRLAILQHAAEVSGNVAQTCRYYWISQAGTVAEPGESLGFVAALPRVEALPGGFGRHRK